ncbi:hypothetical protein OA92_10260 [Marinomonas sp. SBI22]|uniref:DMT family transporter n=1 Tax=unclassified Marinomonas TaxID=196814 RepID=UPI0007AF841F|nr:MULTISPECIES: DMT family transporter [unclassified Marinomonas]KZM43120.1 hypothetical protein OA92_10260 [Marinomonas sp. SBI22]KZM44691.1 hypothetical protein OA91_09685 [Marinomonas sp. SBI8L]
MNKTYSYATIALFSGALLALMIQLNSQLALLNSPLEASWIAHGLGAFCAYAILLIIGTKKLNAGAIKDEKAKWYSYLGGLPGAMTVMLAAVTVNSELGLAGTLSLALLGQILFSLIVDSFGLFNSPKRRLGWHDVKVIFLILSGSMLIIFAGNSL